MTFVAPGTLVTPFVGDGTYVSLQQDGGRPLSDPGLTIKQARAQRFQKHELGIIIAVRLRPNVDGDEALVLTARGCLGWITKWRLNIESLP